MFSGDPLLNAAGVMPTLDGRTPVYIELGADPRLAPGFDAPPGSICRAANSAIGTIYFWKTDFSPTAWERLSLGAVMGTSDWLSHVRSVVDPILDLSDGGSVREKGVFFDECEYNLQQRWTVATANTGAVNDESAVDVSRSGAYIFTTGATANSLARITPFGTKLLLGGRNTEPWAMATRIRILDTPDAQTTMRIALSTAALAVQASWGINGAVSTTAFTVTNGAAATATGGTIETGSYHTFILLNDKTNTRFFVDYVEVASVATSIGANAMLPLLDIQNGTTAAAKRFRMDKIAIIASDRNA